jgi:hypothetical protein
MYATSGNINRENKGGLSSDSGGLSSSESAKYGIALVESSIHL